jgi:UDP-2-acetamido-2-deoxy-ribo-hexuluronate aminotransferase
MKMMRVHRQNKRYHHKYIGIGGRLDALQTTVLLTKIPRYHTELEGRNRVAQAHD